MTRALTQRVLVSLVCLNIVLCSVSSNSYLHFLQDCKDTKPLGLITGDIQDWQISASSTYPSNWDPACHERYGRVYQPNGVAWCAKHKSSSEWLQVDLGLASKVTGLMTQGRGDGIEWVSTYLVSYSLDAFHWQYVSDQYGNQKIFDGNSNSYTVKLSYLDKPFLARYVKFHTVTWNRHPSMRVEIIGCQVCSSPIALPPYSKISASSERNQATGSNCQADDGYIITNKGWCARENDNNQWLQVDIGPPALVTGLVTKGRGEAGKQHWVTRFRVSYSNDTTTWHFYTDSSYQEIKEFGGNVDKDTARYHYLSFPFIARFVRFHPLEWNKSIGMRAGLVGCSYQGQCGPGFVEIVNQTPCVENLAYKKSSWINNKRQYKRHVRSQWLRGHASRAVDGDVSHALESCTVLDNFYVDKPTWMVDLGQRVQVSGVKIATWQGQDQELRNAYRDYMYNLDKLTIYVDTKNGKQHSATEVPSYNVCGSISRINEAIFQPVLHIQCTVPLKGRFVYIEASGLATRWTRLFSAILCEVMIYE